MRQEMVVIGNEWNFGCCAERREFSIVRIFNEDKVVGIDTAGKLSLWPKEISELIPTEGRNSAQNKLGLAPGRFVPDQLKASLPDSREDTRRCAFRVGSRGYEDISVDDNPIHSYFINRKLAKISPKSSRVVPSSRASARRLGSGSTPMIGSQPTIRAAINPPRPTRRPHKLRFDRHAANYTTFRHRTGAEPSKKTTQSCPEFFHDMRRREAAEPLSLSGCRA